MATRIDADVQANAGVKRLRLPPRPIWRKQQTLNDAETPVHCSSRAVCSLVYDLFAAAHGLASLDGARTGLAAFWMWHGAGDHACNVCCVKFLHRPPGTAGAYFLAGYFSTLNLYKSAFPELSFLCCSLYFADCLTEDNNSVPVCLSPVVVDSQRKASKRFFTLT